MCGDGLWGYDERPDPNRAGGSLFVFIYAYREDKRMQAKAAIEGKRMLMERGGGFQQNLSELDQPSTVDIVYALPKNPFGTATYDL